MLMWVKNVAVFANKMPEKFVCLKKRRNFAPSKQQASWLKMTTKG
jgi:hypothetical protein